MNIVSWLCCYTGLSSFVHTLACLLLYIHWLVFFCTYTGFSSFVHFVWILDDDFRFFLFSFYKPMGLHTASFSKMKIANFRGNTVDTPAINDWPYTSSRLFLHFSPPSQHYKRTMLNLRITEASGLIVYVLHDVYIIACTYLIMYSRKLLVRVPPLSHLPCIRFESQRYYS